MDKKLLLLFVAFTLLATGDSLRFRLGRIGRIFNRGAQFAGKAASFGLGVHQAISSHSGGYPHLPRAAACARTGYGAARDIFDILSDGDSADEQTIQSLRNVKEQDPDSYNAAMMVIADEMVREAEDKLKMADSLISGENSNDELEQWDIEEEAEKDDDHAADIAKTTEK